VLNNKNIISIVELILIISGSCAASQKMIIFTACTRGESMLIAGVVKRYRESLQ